MYAVCELLQTWCVQQLVEHIYYTHNCSQLQAGVETVIVHSMCIVRAVTKNCDFSHVHVAAVTMIASKLHMHSQTGNALHVTQVSAVASALCRPPKVAFKWRHWGKMTGPLTCPLHNGLRMVAQPTNEVVSLTGVAFCTLSDKFQIQNLEVYFDQNEPMNSMVKVNNSPIGLPAKGKTAGGVEVELKPPGPQASPERKKAITRDDKTASSLAETRKPEPQMPLEKQFSSPNQQEGSTGVWGGIRGWWNS